MCKCGLFHSQIASKRCHSDYTEDCVIPQLGSGPFSDNQGSGYYTVEEFRDILKHAKDRHIEIIPEVDLPAHSVAAIAAMEERERTIDKLRMHEYEPLETSYLLYDRQPTQHRNPAEKRDRDDINPCLDSTYRFDKLLIWSNVDTHFTMNGNFDSATRRLSCDYCNIYFSQSFAKCNCERKKKQL